MREDPDGEAGDTTRSGVGRAVESIAAVGATGLAPRYAARLALFFTALFMVAGTKLPYLPVWLQWRGLSASEIALVVAAPLFLRILAGPVIAMAADRWGNRRQAAILLAALALVGALLLSVAEGFWPILGVTLLGALAAMGLMPLAETFAMSGVRRGGLDYGRMRLWGSVSFIAVGFAAGSAITIYGPGSILALLVAGSVATFAVALVLPPDPDAASPSGRRATIAVIGRAVLVPRFLLFLVAAGAVQSSHAVFYTFGVIEWQRQGHSATWCATLWAVGVIAEIGIFAFSRSIAARLGAVGLLIAGAAAGAIRWAAMAFDPPLAMLLPLQALHGLTFGAAHLGALYFISAHVPSSEAATAQALYASVTAGIGMGLATLAAGPLYAGLGGQAYLPMSMICIVGALATVPLLRGRAGTPDAGAA